MLDHFSCLIMPLIKMYRKCYKCCRSKEIEPFNYEIIQEIYSEGVSKLELDMSFDKIVKELRDTRIYLNSKVLNDKLNYEINNDDENIINIF